MRCLPNSALLLLITLVRQRPVTITRAIWRGADIKAGRMLSTQRPLDFLSLAGTLWILTTLSRDFGLLRSLRLTILVPPGGRGATLLILSVGKRRAGLNLLLGLLWGKLCTINFVAVLIQSFDFLVKGCLCDAYVKVESRVYTWLHLIKLFQW